MLVGSEESEVSEVLSFSYLSSLWTAQLERSIDVSFVGCNLNITSLRFFAPPD